MTKHPIETLKDLLKFRGVKQKDLALLIGVTTIEMSRYLNRKTNMKLDLYHKAIEILSQEVNI